MSQVFDAVINNKTYSVNLFLYGDTFTYMVGVESGKHKESSFAVKRNLNDLLELEEGVILAEEIKNRLFSIIEDNEKVA